MRLPEARASRQRDSSGIGAPDVSDVHLRRALSLIRVLGSPALPGILWHCAMGFAGVGAIVLGALGSGGSPVVPLQVPYLVSGGMVGVALVAVGALFASMHSERHDWAQASVQMDEVIDEVGSLVNDVLTARRGGARP